MPITDKYKEMGTVVCGKLEAGVITRDHHLIMMPNRVSFFLCRNLSKELLNNEI